jgi:hypothetical protein
MLGVGTTPSQIATQVEWNAYELAQWRLAVLERGLKMTAVDPDVRFALAASFREHVAVTSDLRDEQRVPTD